MKVLFVNPAQSAPVEHKFTNIKIPLGFIYMAGVLEENGFEVSILDGTLHYDTRTTVDDEIVRIGLTPQDIADEVDRFHPDIIGVSCAYSMYEPDSFAVIDFLKEKYSNIPIVVGGAHSSANAEYVLRNKNIDLVVVGEGELTMLEVAKALSKGQSLADIKGTARMVDGKMKATERRDYIEDLDSLTPAWHLIDLEKYFKHPSNSMATMRNNSVDVVSSRGCPGNCVFCSIHTVWGRGWRGRTAKNVVDELQLLHDKYGARQFRFQDDNLTLKKDRIIEICDEIINRKLNIRWDTPNGVALWTLDEEIVLKMKKAGCYRITFGIESGSKETQKYIGKVIKTEKMERLIKYCHKIGMWICGTFIIGFPDESIESIEETRQYILHSGINFPFIYTAQPFQGTRMYEDFKKNGLIGDDFLLASTVASTKYDTLHFKSAELNALKTGIYKEFYRKKALSYLSPFALYRDLLSKIRSFEDLGYFFKMINSVLFKFSI